MTIQATARRDFPREASPYALAGSFVVSAFFVLALWQWDPLFERARDIVSRVADTIDVVEIPRTAQQQEQAAPARPQVPIMAVDEADIEDLTIENTDLYESASVPVPDKVSETHTVLADEEAPPMEFWMVEVLPTLLRESVPEYPEIARQAGIEGVVTVVLVVGTRGQVESVEILRGPPVFHEAARVAALRMRFSPAMQNDRPVRVKITRQVGFRLR